MLGQEARPKNRVSNAAREVAWAAKHGTDKVTGGAAPPVAGGDEEEYEGIGENEDVKESENVEE